MKRYPTTALHDVTTLKMEAAKSSETLVSYLISTRCHNPEDGDSKVLRNVGVLRHYYTVSPPWRWRQQSSPKLWYPTTSLHGVTTLKMGAAKSSETLVSYRITTRCHNPEDGKKVLRNIGTLLHHYTMSQPWRWRQQSPPKHLYPTSSLHDVTTLKMEAAKSSETLVPYLITTRCHNPEDHDVELHRLENLRFVILVHLLSVRIFVYPVRFWRHQPLSKTVMASWSLCQSEGCQLARAMTSLCWRIA
jgi:hypothetical protein